MKHLAAAVIAFGLSLGQGAALAQTQDESKVDALFAALAMPELLEIMRVEGLEYGDTIAADMFAGDASPQWAGMVSDIYSVDYMTEEIRAAFDEELEGDDIDAMIAFFTSQPGQKIVDLEVSARDAMLDDAVEMASKENATIAAADLTPRFLLVEEFVAVNDLIETNVVSAMNANYAFYMGLLDGGAMPEGVTADTALQEIWAQEDDIRATTSEWMYSFLLLAYQPLSDDELKTYTAFMESEAGRDLNHAVFVAFDGMFDDISRALGRASSRFMISQEL